MAMLVITRGYMESHKIPWFQTTNQMGIPGKISQGDPTKIGAPRCPNRPKHGQNQPADKNVEELILDKRKRCVKC